MGDQGPKIKVCGLRDNISAVNDLNPDFMGFIFYPKSPRYVGESFVMPDGLNGEKVGVFVNQPVLSLIAAQKKYQLDYLQLHGDENVDYCVELKANAIKIIKVFAGNNLPSQADLDEFAPFIDYYLFDTKLDQHGGNGVVFDWSVIKSLKLKKPLFLSGGISLKNSKQVKQLGSTVYAIDVNSKFEIDPGLKDITKLQDLKNNIS